MSQRAEPVYCDGLTLAAVASELRSLLLGGRVQEVLAVDRFAVGFEIYASSSTEPDSHPTKPRAAGQRHYLLVSADPSEGGRIHLVPHKLRRGQETPSPLLLRLRKNVEGARFTRIWQPPHERILHLTLSSADQALTLVVEAMGRICNIILVEEDGTILECMRRVASYQSRYRVVLPGHPYVPPPPQKKVLTADLTPDRLAQLLAADQGDPVLWQKLVATVGGVSPLLAKEVVFRATGRWSSTVGDTNLLLESLRELQGITESGLWQPCLGMLEGKPVAYAPYLLTHLAACEPRASISAAMYEYYENRTGPDPYAAAKQRVADLIDKAKARLTRKRSSLERSSTDDAVIAELRRKGELLFTFAHEIPPRQATVTLGFEGETALSIALDARLTAVENGREYFRRYEKARAAAAEVPGLIAQVDEELTFLQQLETDLDLAQDQPGIAAVETALAEAGYVPKPPRSKPPPSAPLQVTSVDGFTIWVGRNSWQNEEVTFKMGSARDLWLHADGVPGAHVIVRTEGREVPESTLAQAAQLAASHSAARHNGSARVAYTLRQNVKRARSGRPGQVYLTSHKTLVVRTDT